MPAPSDTTWGNVIYSGNSEGKIGISRTWEDKGTYEHAVVTVWFWTKYSVTDANNSFYYARDSVPTYVGSKNIKHTSNSSWSTSNQTILATYTYDFPKGKSRYTTTFNASITGIDVLGSGNVSNASRLYTVGVLASYTVSYNANGGSGAPSNQTKWYGETLTLSSSIPTKEGHTFMGWGTSSTDTTVDYAKGGAYTSNASITLYAIWKANTYEVWYDANGGENAPSGQTKTYGVPLPLQTGIPTRKDHNFLGWSTNSSATEPTYKSGDLYTTNAGVTLYAVWEVAYIKPRITNVTVARSLDGEADDFGTECRIKFDWATDLDGVFYAVYYKKTTESDYKSAQRLSLDGRSGSVDTLIYTSSGNVEFDTDFAYDIRLNVTDSNGYNTVEKILNAVFLPMDFTPEGKSVSFGEPAKEDEEGVLRFAYKKVDLAPKEELWYRGEKFFGAKQIWTGQELMKETQSITLQKKISEMKNGLLLVFARGTFNLTTYFVPKEVVLAYTRTTHCFPLCTGMLDYIGSKTLNISDTKIEGHTDNDATGTNGISGITYHNELFYLVKIYEV